MAPKLLSISFSLVLNFFLGDTLGGIFLHSFPVGRLFHFSCLEDKLLSRKVLTRDLLLADEVDLVNCFTTGSKEIDLAISLKKTNILCLDLSLSFFIFIDKTNLEVVPP